MKNSDKNNDSVLITGATSGIGRQLALDYAEAGFKVTACGRNTEELSKLEASSGNIKVLAFDVSDYEATRSSLKSLKPDLIILNAGVASYIEKGAIDTKKIRDVFNVNFFGVLNCVEALQDGFSKSTHLAIVSSSVTYVPLPRTQAYGSSKAALTYFTKSLAIDLDGRSLDKVTLISPGFVKTAMTAKNDFKMPAAVSVERASKYIMKGLAKGKDEIHFPLRFTLFLKFLSILPYKFQLFVGHRIRR